MKGKNLTPDQYADHWVDNNIFNHLYSHPMHNRRFTTIAKYMSGNSFVDVGCGCGDSTLILQEMSGIKNFVGIDFSYKMLAKVKERFPDKISHFRYLNGIEDLATMSLYDTVVCSEVIEHLQDYQHLFNLLVPMARETLILTTPSRHINDPGHIHQFDERMIIKMCNGSGFTFTFEKDKDFWYIVGRRL